MPAPPKHLILHLAGKLARFGSKLSLWNEGRRLRQVAFRIACDCDSGECRKADQGLRFLARVPAGLRSLPSLGDLEAGILPRPPACLPSSRLPRGTADRPPPRPLPSRRQRRCALSLSPASALARGPHHLITHRPELKNGCVSKQKSIQFIIRFLSEEQSPGNPLPPPSTPPHTHTAAAASF